MAPERIYVFTASGTWRQQEERLEHVDVEEIKSSCKSSIMKPTRKARANMCKATLKKHSSLQVRCRSARTAQGGHRSSYWQLISEQRGSGGRCDGRGERGGGTARLGLALGHVAGWEAVEGTWQLGFQAASWPFTSCVILG